MATLALSVAGQVVGGIVGGPIGATIGRALGGLAGSAIDSALFSPKPAAAPVTGSDISLQGSTEGGPLIRAFGWNRLTGNIIWATQLEEMTQQSSGAKGTSPGTATTTTIFANFAVALCEGEVARLGRIWADGEVLETEGLSLRFYTGSETQLPDSLIEAKQGTGNAPAYRGLCYLVFERLPLTDYGNRIPNIAVEICRPAGALEADIRAVTIIPGATEFGYDPVPRVRVLRPGATDNENAHMSAEISDWTLSLDQLQALCPNLEHVSLVVSWFGDNLDCSLATIRPKVEAHTRVVEGTNWTVSGISRASAKVVSSHDGGPAYGGTPSDNAVLAAIADLKARGLKVTLYPMIDMDIATGNTLTDPYTGASGQPAYPWRGRITCAPGPGITGTPDQTSGIADPVAAFLGSAAAADFAPGSGTVNFSGGADWGFRRFILHYASLCRMAGGVDAFLIGSEMVGLSTLRDQANGFPFVAGLVTLASDVRAVLGATTKLTYGADWSEFSGLQPADAPGDKFFHLDALWSAGAIDAIGIDNYMPIADWRDGTDHPDAALYDGPYELAYLSANIAGGEGYDWYYASGADRIASQRTPLTDGTYDEPWVWRFKDLVNWWTHPHYNRVGGTRASAPTAWVPYSKPIWFTELGCAAVDKGANQPNKFPDPKSSESGKPYFSNGAPDPLAQRQFLRAHLDWWGAGANAHNPASNVYAGTMLDPARIYLWTWDARPFPAFPNDTSVWSDGPNYASGHWLNGRLGAAASDELLAALAHDYRMPLGPVDAAAPLVFGLATEGLVSLRDASAQLCAATGLAIHDSPAGVSFTLPKPRLALTLDPNGLARTDNPLTSRRRPDASEAIASVTLAYIDRQRDYLAGTVTAMRLGTGAGSADNSGLVLDPGGARIAAERRLGAANPARDTLEFALPPSQGALEAGDTVTVGGQGDGPFVIGELRDTTTRAVSATMIAATTKSAIITVSPASAVGSVSSKAIPLVAAAHLPALPSDLSQSRLVVGASSSPWPGTISLNDTTTGAAVARLAANADLGELAAPLAGASPAVWDDASTLTVTLYSGHLASADELSVLAGVNRLAVLTDAGAWECIGFATAILVAAGQYRLTRLLRGQQGTVPAIGPAAAGNRVMVLAPPITTEPVPIGWLGETLALTAYAGASDATGTALGVPIDMAPALPLAPVHLVAKRDPASLAIAFSWVRCSRADSGSWNTAEVPLDFTPEAYEVSILKAGNPVRTLAVAAPWASYSSAQQTADFGALPDAFAFSVTQTSAVFGPGLAANGVFNA